MYNNIELGLLMRARIQKLLNCYGFKCCGRGVRIIFAIHLKLKGGRSLVYYYFRFRPTPMIKHVRIDPMIIDPSSKFLDCVVCSSRS